MFITLQVSRVRATSLPHHQSWPCPGDFDQTYMKPEYVPVDPEVLNKKERKFHPCMRVAASPILYMGIATVRSSSSTSTHSSFHCFASVLTLTLVSVRGILPLKQKGAHRRPTVPQLFSQQPITKSPLRSVMPWIRGGESGTVFYCSRHSLYIQGFRINPGYIRVNDRRVQVPFVGRMI